jgi:hypothetical protein
MATGQWPTIADVLSRTDGAHKQMYIAEMLSQSIALYEDLVLVEASEVSGHEFAFRTSIPAGYWRQANVGVPYAKSTTAKSRVGMGTLEDYSQADRLIAEESGDVEEFRKNEDVSFLEGMGQTIEQTGWYGNTTATPAEFMGLAGFYNTVNTNSATGGAQNAANVIDAGGTGSSNASIWLLCHGVRTFYGLYPRGSKAGLTSEDKADTVPGFDSLGNRFEAYTTWFRQRIALCPQDWRQCARIANIDVTAAGLAGPNAEDLFATIRQMLLLPPSLTKQSSGITETDAPNDPAPGKRPVIYWNRTIAHWASIQAMRNRNVLMSMHDYAGIPCEGINGIPIKISDQLLTTESRVV